MRAILLLAPSRRTLGWRAPFGNAAFAGTCFVGWVEAIPSIPERRPRIASTRPAYTLGHGQFKSRCDPFASCNPKKYGGQISTDECQIFSGRFGGGLI